MPLLKEGRAAFKAEIRGMQRRRCLDGSDTMLIWLGKVVLHQRGARRISARGDRHAGGVYRVHPPGAAETAWHGGLHGRQRDSAHVPLRNTKRGALVGVRRL